MNSGRLRVFEKVNLSEVKKKVKGGEAVAVR